jgi:proline iminopeptidase
MGVERMHVLGHSWGGFVAMAYGARYPSRLASLILVDSAAPKWSDTRALFAEVFPESYERAEQFEAAQKKGDPTARAAVLREYVTWLFYSPEKRDGYIPHIGLGAENTAINVGLQNSVGDTDLTPDIRKFTFPSLIITGRFDMNIMPATAYALHKHIPGSRFVVFERSGHVPSYEEPELFLRTIEQFLAEIP